MSKSRTLIMKQAHPAQPPQQASKSKSPKKGAAVVKFGEAHPLALAAPKSKSKTKSGGQFQNAVVGQFSKSAIFDELKTKIKKESLNV